MCALARLLLVTALGLGVVSCVPKAVPGWDAAGQLDALRAEARAVPDDVGPLLRRAAMVSGWIGAGAGEAWGVDLTGEADELIDTLADFAAANPRARGRSLAARGRLLAQRGRPAEAHVALHASLASRQTLEGLVPLLDLLAPDLVAQAALCAETRWWVSYEGNVVAVLDACATHDPDLPWASAEDRALYARLLDARGYQRSLAHEVRWADPERLQEAYGVDVRADEAAGSGTSPQDDQ
jgi:hypothetical protein